MRPTSAAPTSRTSSNPALAEAVKRLIASSPRDEAWEVTVAALVSLTSSAGALGGLPSDAQRSLVQPFIALLTGERSALVGAAADSLSALAAAAAAGAGAGAGGGVLPQLATEALWTRLLENAGAGNRINARANASAALALAVRSAGASAAWTAVARVLLPPPSLSARGSAAPDDAGVRAVGTREAAHRVLNTMLGRWSDDTLHRATGLSGGSVGGGDGLAFAEDARGGGGGGAGGRASDPVSALAALLRLGICDGSQAVRRLGRTNFRIASARLPAVVEAVRTRYGRSASRQLSSVLTEADADAAALADGSQDGGGGLLFGALDGAPIALTLPDGARSFSSFQHQLGGGGESGGGGADAEVPPSPPHGASPRASSVGGEGASVKASSPQLSPAAELVALAGQMKLALSAVMTGMTPQLALLSKLDKRVAAANVRAAAEAAAGSAGALAAADDVLARARGARAAVTGAELMDYTSGELAATARAFNDFTESLRAILPPLEERIAAAIALDK